ncbi:MAG: hypothetical protein COW16_11885 [Sphingomonadales bacterium CG12_big_fil_rev_8_21_14_0_65_65_10]|nr:MAG: hypothetical protein COW16_11885 [Sphingomonadales bacterium CG12_big_fil_rev_8_21_14_0_65_65_10]
MIKLAKPLVLLVLVAGCTSTERFEFPSPEGRWVAIAEIEEASGDDARHWWLDIREVQSGDSHRYFIGSTKGTIAINWISEMQADIEFCDIEGPKMTESAPFDLAVTYLGSSDQVCERTDPIRLHN